MTCLLSVCHVWLLKAKFKLEQLKKRVVELKRPITKRTPLQQERRQEALLEAEAELKQQEEDLSRLNEKVKQDKAVCDTR